MKKILMVGAVVVTMLVLFLLIPNTRANATEKDFIIEGSTLVDYVGTASNVSIPASVETIGRSAFENNSYIKKVTIPESVETIEEYAFWGCSNLETVVLGEGLYEVADFTFSACEKLKEVAISDSIRRIGIMAFADCKSLTEIYIPPTVTDIHATAFDGIYYLNIRAEQFSYPYEYALERGEMVANLPEHLKETPQPEVMEPQVTVSPTPSPIPTPTPQPGVLIGSTSIVGNSAVVFIDNEEMETSRGYNPEVVQPEPTQIPAKIKLADWTYYGDESLVNIELGENISSIGSFAFSRSALQSITLSDGVESIEYAAFYYCENLEKIEIPDSVTYIGEKAFAGTPWLESFYDGSMVLEENSDFLIVGDGVLIAYRGNKSEVNIPEGVKYIAEDAFVR